MVSNAALAGSSKNPAIIRHSLLHAIQLEVRDILDWGYLMGSAIFLSVLAALVGAQIAAKKFHPFRYWATIVASATAEAAIGPTQAPGTAPTCSSGGCFDVK
jgi:hypothetical protein